MCVCVLARTFVYPIISPSPSKTNGCWPPSVDDEGRQTLREAISEGHTLSLCVCVCSCRVIRAGRDATPAAEGVSRYIRGRGGKKRH